MSTAPTPAPAAATPPPGQPDWAPAQKVCAGAAIVGLAVYVVAGVIGLGSSGDEHRATATGQFFLSWLVGFVFWISMPLGAMALLMIHYLSKTSWGLLLKKPLEACMRTLPLFAVLAIPVLIAAALHETTPYWWTHPEVEVVTPEMREAQQKYDEYKKQEDAYYKGGQDPTLKPQKLDPQTASLVLKTRVIDATREENTARREGNFGFLSTPAFIGGTVLYFLIWGGFIYLLNKMGKAADDDPAKVVPSLETAKNWSGPGLIVYAIVGTAAASHWVMSLEPGWASTMFPVIYSVNQLLTAFCFCVAVVITIAPYVPPYPQVMRTKFRIDFGSFMLALTLFWSYTSFSQYMLVWIGNLPEEIPFFLKRSNPPMQNGWWWVSFGLIVFHFAVPFIVLLFRDIKNHPHRLRWMAIYIQVVCAIDVLWWISPAVHHEGVPLFWVMDVGALLGVGGLFGLFFLYQLRSRRLFPMNEAYMLPEGHDDHHGDHGGTQHGHH